MSSATGADSSFFYVLDERMRLLFADDDPILREFAKVHLASEEASVTTAGDGEEAWQALRVESYDVVLVDLEMPRLDGFGLLKRMRADPRHRDTPVIVVTGREDVAAIDRAFDSGATSFVVKPMNWRLLTYQVRFIVRSEREVARRQMAIESEAVAASAYKHLMRESAELLRLAVQQDGPLRTAARDYAALLSELANSNAARARAA
jgi:DNA-binding response OmpR family regulator